MTDVISKIILNNKKCVIIEESELQKKYYNTGHMNTGNWNTGYRNTGYNNSGNSNSGNSNSGDRNSGYRNTGDSNSGSYNSGNCNTGDWNSGYWNSGNKNTGDGNTGDWNSGYWNSGYLNSGNRNSGNWNSGNLNSGFFNTDEPCLRFFNKQTDFKKSEVDFNVYPKFLFFSLTEWIKEENMTNEEKENNPSYKTTGGYLKTYSYKEALKNSWNKATREDKEKVLTLPNFDNDIFMEISGIDVIDELKTGE